MGSYVPPPSGPNSFFSSYGSYGGEGYDSFRDDRYGMPYNSSYDNPDYDRSYQQRLVIIIMSGRCAVDVRSM